MTDSSMSTIHLPTTAGALVRFENVSVAFENQHVLSSMSATIKRGEFISLVGETGIGKTTLLRMIYFDLIPDEGRVIVGDFDSSTIKKRDIPKLRRMLGIAFQDFKLLEDRNVHENVAFALEVTGVEKTRIGERTSRVLSDVGLSLKHKSMPHELSGGEQQRVVFARALVNEPMLLLVDEPTGNLDTQTSMELLQLLNAAHQRGTTIILATHNYDFVRRSKSRILQIKEGKLVERENI